MPVSQILSVVGRSAGGGGGTPQPSGLYAWEWDADNSTSSRISNTYYTGSGSSGTSDQNVLMSIGGSGVSTTAVTWYNSVGGKQIQGLTSNFFLQTPDFLQTVYSSAWASSSRTGLTIELWFYPTAGNRTLVSEHGLGGAGVATWHYNLIELNSNGTVVANIWPYTGGNITTANSVNYNAWNHLIYTYNTSTSTLTLQVNNKTVVTSTGKSWDSGVENGGGLNYAIGYADSTNLMSQANTTNFDGKWGKVRIANYPMPSNYVSDWTKYNPFSITDSGITLGTDWTVEVVGDFYPSNFWATLWGNDAWSLYQGHLAYFTGANSLTVGRASGGQDEYNLTDNISVKSYWAFVHTNGGGIQVYRNGALLTPAVNNYNTATNSIASNTLLFGARHGNVGVGTTDPCPGNYLYTNVSATPISAGDVTTNYNSYKITYGLP